MPEHTVLRRLHRQAGPDLNGKEYKPLLIKPKVR